MYERHVFAGLSDTPPVELPSGYRRLLKKHGVDVSEPTSFISVLDTLREEYNIEWRDLFHSNEAQNNKTKVDHYKALVNPAWEGLPSSDLPEDRKDAVWHIPTKRYTRVPHHDVWHPLAKAIAKRGDHTDVFGEVRTRRQGGEVHMDLFFKNADLPSAADGEQIIGGISTGHDYFGNTRLYVDFIAYHDTGDGVGQIVRYLFDPRRRKHTGKADEEVVNWFQVGIERLDKLGSRLYNVVGEAMNYEFDMSEFACSPTGFYEHLGLPNRGQSALADPAGDRVNRTTVNSYTAWHMFKAGMWAIEHHYDSRDTSAYKKHINTVNTLLFNPALAEQRVLKSIEETLVNRPDDEHEIWEFIDDEDDREDALTAIRTRAKSISDGVDEFQTTRDRIRTLLKDEGTIEAEDPNDIEFKSTQSDDEQSKQRLAGEQ